MNHSALNPPGCYPSRSGGGTRSQLKEELTIQLVRKIVVKGAADVVFFRSSSAHLVVAKRKPGGHSEYSRTDWKVTSWVIEQASAFPSAEALIIHISGTGNILC